MQYCLQLWVSNAELGAVSRDSELSSEVVYTMNTASCRQRYYAPTQPRHPCEPSPNSALTTLQALLLQL